MDENTLHEILNEVDLNKNGQVELNEFLQVSCTERKQMYLCVFFLFIFNLLVVNGCSRIEFDGHTVVTSF